jgi:hypothetical protein
MRASQKRLTTAETSQPLTYPAYPPPSSRHSEAKLKMLLLTQYDKKPIGCHTIFAKNVNAAKVTISPGHRVFRRLNKVFVMRRLHPAAQYPLLELGRTYRDSKRLQM